MIEGPRERQGEPSGSKEISIIKSNVSEEKTPFSARGKEVSLFATPSSDKDKPIEKLTPGPKKNEISETASATEQPSETKEESVDPHLASVIERSKQSLGTENTEKVIEVSKRLDEKHEGELRWTLAKVPDYADAARAAKIDPEATQDLLLHTIEAHKGDERSRNYNNLNHLTRGLTYSAAHNEKVTTEEVGELKTMITTSSDKNAILNGLQAYEASRMAGLSLNDSVSLVKTTAEHADESFYGLPSYEISRLTNSLTQLHMADADPEKVKKMFTKVAQLSAQDKNHAYTDFQQGVDLGLEIGIKPKQYVETVAGKMEKGTTVNEALFGTLIEYEDAAPPRENKEEDFHEPDFTEKREELTRRVDDAFENPVVVSYNPEAGQSKEYIESVHSSPLKDLPDSQIYDVGLPSKEERAYRISVNSPEEYDLLFSIVGEKMVENNYWNQEFADQFRKGQVAHERQHAAVADRANLVRADTEIITTYNIDFWTDPKVGGKGVQPSVIQFGKAPAGVWREITRAPAELSNGDIIHLGIPIHKNRPDIM